MVLFIESLNKERKHFKITEFNDLQPVFDLYPRTHDIAIESDSLEDALNNIAEYLSSHHMNAWVEGSDLSKSLREKALSLGLGLAAAITPVATSHIGVQNNVPQVQNSPVDLSGFGSHPRDAFLWNLKALESNHGKNTKHKVIRSGLSAGEKAMGQWGLLPKTIKEIVNRFKMSGKSRPDIDKLATMSNDALESHINKNPKLELELARKLADHVLTRNNGNEHKAAFAWLNGHNLSPESITKDKLLHSNYVDKYKKIDKHNPFKSQKPEELNFKFMFKSNIVLHDADFAEKVKKWYKLREDQITENPTRSTNFGLDPGRLRDSKLDDIKPDSMLNDMEKLKSKIKQANNK